MAENISKLSIGHRRIIYKGIDLGHTLDGVELTIGREFEDLVVDKYGSTPVDKALTGTEIEIEVKLAQTDYDTWRHAVPESFDYDGAGDLNRVDFGADAGTLLRGDAGELVLHDPKRDLSDRSNDYVFYKAVSADDVETEFKIDEQQAIGITFQCLVDESYNSGRRLGHYGAATVS